MPRVSVFMPSYNHARWVAMAIHSVLEQTYKDFEIVVTDDGSSDGTADVIERMKAPQVKLKRFEKNRGVCAAENDAIRRSTGEYLCLLNSDDIFLPQKLELQAAFLDSHPDVGAVFGMPVFCDEENHLVTSDRTFNGKVFETGNRDQAGWLRHFFFSGNCLCHPTVMIRRECYEKAGLYDERLAQLPDFEMWIRLVAAYPIHVMDTPLTAFRIRRNGANASAPRADTLVRLMWEDTQVRKHYLRLPQELFERTFANELAQLNLDPRSDRATVIGRMCLATSSLPLQRFGLDLLFHALPAQGAGAGEGFAHADYIRATGARDVFHTLLPYRVVELEQNKASLEGALREHKAPPARPSIVRVETTPAWAAAPPTGPMLHLGCGPNVLAGWVNMDIEPRPGVVAWDLNRGLPFENESVSLIYSEHMIEHLDFTHATTLFQECFRALGPGGILRLSTPDLAVLVDAYSKRSVAEWQDVGWVAQTPCDLMNEGMRSWGHQYVFDSEKLVRCLESAGFQKVQAAPWRASSIAQLKNLETRPFHGELIFEAQKTMTA